MAVYFLNKHVKQLERRLAIKYTPNVQSMFPGKKQETKKCKSVKKYLQAVWELYLYLINKQQQALFLI